METSWNPCVSQLTAVEVARTSHGFTIGCRTGNIIGYGVKSKACSTCTRVNFLNSTPEEHDCRINWEGASGGMEAGLALDLCIGIHGSDYDIFVEHIVSDDDSKMRAHLRLDGKGKLPTSIPIPTFYANPSHRIKVMASPIFKLVNGTKNSTRV